MCSFSCLWLVGTSVRTATTFWRRPATPFTTRPLGRLLHVRILSTWNTATTLTFCAALPFDVCVCVCEREREREILQPDFLLCYYYMRTSTPHDNLLNFIQFDFLSTLFLVGAAEDEMIIFSSLFCIRYFSLNAFFHLACANFLIALLI